MEAKVIALCLYFVRLKGHATDTSIRYIITSYSFLCFSVSYLIYVDYALYWDQGIYATGLKLLGFRRSIVNFYHSHD